MDLTVYSDSVAAAILKHNFLPLCQVHKAASWNLLAIQLGSCSKPYVTQPRVWRHKRGEKVGRSQEADMARKPHLPFCRRWRSLQTPPASIASLTLQGTLHCEAVMSTLQRE